MMSNRFQRIDIYMECDWYLFSPQMQRILPIMLLNSDDVIIQGYGNISFTRELLKSVIANVKWIFICYLMNFLLTGFKRCIFLLYDTSELY